ncbi:MAG TPA: peptidylprolyl isomerase, partial [Dehalococcoidia bacterium]
MRIIPAFAFAFIVVAVMSAQTPKEIPAPSDVAAPPKDARKTSSGLATKVLQAGTGKDRPRADELVTV